LPNGIPQIQDQEVNEPAQIVRTVLQAHDFHSLSSLRFLLTCHSLDYVNEDK
jgi:hypothetical protein